VRKNKAIYSLSAVNFFALQKNLKNVMLKGYFEVHKNDMAMGEMMR